MVLLNEKVELMLDHFGEEELGLKLLEVIENVTSDGFLTPDIGGTFSTTQVTDEIIKRVKAL